MRVVLVLLTMTGCGGTATGGGNVDGSSCGADGVCDPSCSADPDCPAPCGDGTCGATELCSTCPADCATRVAVCGNGACDPSETSASCYADCGPSPWPWLADEQRLLDLVNAVRTAGFKCPNASTTITASALAFQPTFVPEAHEWVWEIAHQNYVSPSPGGACNGRTFDDRKAEGGFVAFVLGKDYNTVDDAVASWKASATLCPIMMNPARAQAAAAVAVDAAQGYLLVMN